MIKANKVYRKEDILRMSNKPVNPGVGKDGSDTVQGFRYLNVADKRQQSAWFQWKFNNPLR